MHFHLCGGGGDDLPQFNVSVEPRWISLTLNVAWLSVSHCWATGALTASQTSLEFYREWPQKEKRCSERQLWGGKKYPRWCQGSKVRQGKVVAVHREVTVTQITTADHQGLQDSRTSSSSLTNHVIMHWWTDIYIYVYPGLKFQRIAEFLCYVFTSGTSAGS